MILKLQKIDLAQNICTKEVHFPLLQQNNVNKNNVGENETIWIFQEYLFIKLNTFIKNQLWNLSKLQLNKSWILTRMLVNLKLKVYLIVAH